MTTARSKLKIIAGKFKGRWIKFEASNAKLRPTLNIVRETLFNWLTPWIYNKDCLDLFAGSGILGFEALSRGANSVRSLENDLVSYRRILENQAMLGLSDLTYKVAKQDVRLWLNQLAATKLSQEVTKGFDLVFLDPPYAQPQELLFPSLQVLLAHKVVNPEGRLYFESSYDLLKFQILESLPAIKILKTGRAGQVYFYLAEKVGPS